MQASRDHVNVEGNTKGCCSARTMAIVEASSATQRQYTKQHVTFRNRTRLGLHAGRPLYSCIRLPRIQLRQNICQAKILLLTTRLQQVQTISGAGSATSPSGCTYESDAAHQSHGRVQACRTTQRLRQRSNTQELTATFLSVANKAMRVYRTTQRFAATLWLLTNLDGSNTPDLSSCLWLCLLTFSRCRGC
jgi:hypothetical protein